MSHWPVLRVNPASRAGVLAALIAGLLLAACGGQSISPLAGADSMAASGSPAAADSAAPNRGGPEAPAAALARARALRATDKAAALALLDKAAAAAPGDRRLDLERGLLAFETGDLANAEKLLRQAHDPKAPDWRQHSALGAVLASRGSQREAQAEFAKALA